jgi:hypothetical protein
LGLTLKIYEMKKIILTIAFLATGLVASAQVGIGNTDPKVSLQVDKSADAAKADGVLVPRVTVAELNTKAAAYGADQNGSLVFITNITGFAEKTSNVTTTGFHYYNNGTSKWTAVDAAPVPYQNIRGTVTLVNAATYTVTASDYVVVTIFNNGVNITIPALTNTAADIGRTLKIINNNTTSTALTFQSTAPLLGNFVANQNRGIEVIWTGISWSCPQK